MFSYIKPVSVEEDQKLIDEITRYENELSQKMGKEIILVAYTKEDE